MTEKSSQKDRPQDVDGDSRATLRSYQEQTNELLELGLRCGTPVDHLMVVHASRRAIEEGDLHRASIAAEDLKRILGW